VDEDSSIDPLSPYARTKAVCEAMFADIAAVQPIRVLSLRYFNPIGADPKMRPGLQLPRPTHCLGQMIQARRDGVPFLVTGTDYPTRDGSGIRDYISTSGIWLRPTSLLLAGSMPCRDGRP
jgi:UDP-glucose 4-epimerase